MPVTIIAQVAFVAFLHLLKHIILTLDYGFFKHIILTLDYGFFKHIILTLDYGFFKHIILTLDDRFFMLTHKWCASRDKLHLRMLESSVVWHDGVRNPVCSA